MALASRLRTCAAVAALAVAGPVAAEPALAGPDVDRAHVLWGELIAASAASDGKSARARAEELAGVEEGSGQPDPLRRAEILLVLAHLTLEDGDPEAAERSLLEAHRLYTRELGVRNPFSGQALLTLGEVYLRRSDVRRARLAVDRAMALLPPSDPMSAFRYAGIYEKLGDEALTLECAELGLRLDPENPAIQNLIAWTTVTRARPSPADLDRAERLARSAVERAPAVAAFADTLGAVLLRREAVAEAAEIFDRLLADEEALSGLDPADEAFVRFHAALAFEATGRPDRAARLVDRVRELPPQASQGIGSEDLASLEARLMAFLPQHSGTLRDR
jgi:tetratricopeptide (TPR) repeat protein